MYKIVLLFTCFAACSSHAVLPLAHQPVVGQIIPALPYLHGHGEHGILSHANHGLGYEGHSLAGSHSALEAVGYGGHGLVGQGYENHIGHHILKRSPHYVAPVSHLGAVSHLGGLGHLGGVGHITTVAEVTPVAVSHQSRVDVHHSPAVVAAPILPLVKPIVAPVVASPVGYGAGLYGDEHYGGGHYGAGHYGAGHYGTGHYGGGHLGYY